MKRAGLFAALGHVVAADVVVLAGVAWNRSSETVVAIELTERELALPHVRSDEDTALTLGLEWTGRGAVRDSRAMPSRTSPGWHDHEWLDRLKLEALGFDCSVDPGASLAPVFYRRQVSRRGWLVLELEGAAFEGRLARMEREIGDIDRGAAIGSAAQNSLRAAQDALERARLEESQLFAVDAGPDPEVLSLAHPDRSRFVLLPALFRIEAGSRTDPDGKVTRHLSGTVSELLISRVHVPVSLTGQIPGLSSRGLDTGMIRLPRYTVTLCTGRRHEPWIESIRRLEPESMPATYPPETSGRPGVR